MLLIKPLVPPTEPAVGAWTAGAGAAGAGAVGACAAGAAGAVAVGACTAGAVGALAGETAMAEPVAAAAVKPVGPAAAVPDDPPEADILAAELVADALADPRTDEAEAATVELPEGRPLAAGEVVRRRVEIGAVGAGTMAISGGPAGLAATLEGAIARVGVEAGEIGMDIVAAGCNAGGAVAASTSPRIERAGMIVAASAVGPASLSMLAAIPTLPELRRRRPGDCCPVPSSGAFACTEKSE